MIFRHVTVDSAEPYELARFWSDVTGWPLGDDDKPGDDEVLVEAPKPVPGLLFIRVPEAKSVKNRLHIDWMPDERTRDEEVAGWSGWAPSFSRTTAPRTAWAG